MPRRCTALRKGSGAEEGVGVTVGVGVAVLVLDAPGLRDGAAVRDAEGGAGDEVPVGVGDGFKSIHCTGRTPAAGMPGPAAPNTVTSKWKAVRPSAYDKPGAGGLSRGTYPDLRGGSLLITPGADPEGGPATATRTCDK